jgi:hypothetical protein
MRNDKLRSKDFYRFFNLGGTPVAKTPPSSVLILATDTGFWVLDAGFRCQPSRQPEKRPVKSK